MSGLTTSDQNRHQEELELVDEAGVDRLGGELGAAYADVRRRPLLHLTDGAGVEVRSIRVRAVEAAASVRE